MSHINHPTHLLQSTERIDQGTPNRQSPHMSAPIHILDDDSLLDIFYLFRSKLTFMYDVGDEVVNVADWRHDERCWYQLAQVCRRWRHLIFDSASYLRFCLVCTYGRPVVDMLAHSPHLPIVLDYFDENHDITAEDEEGIVLALQQRHRVRRIRLLMPGSNLQKLVPAIDGEFPLLELLFVELLKEDREDTNLILPKAFQLPHLRHLMMTNVGLSPALQILTTSISLVTLALHGIQSAHISPNDLLQHLSFLPQLKSLTINFLKDTPNTVIERELLDSPVMTHAATLPDLRWFLFGGTNAYLESLLSRMTTPILETLEITLLYQTTFSTPNLLQFMSTTKNLRLTEAKLNFDGWGAGVEIYPDEGAETCSFFLDVACVYRAEQVSSMVQIFDAFGPVFSAVERLAFAYAYKRDSWSPGQNNVGRAQWRRLLRLFRNVKTLLVSNYFIVDLSYILEPDNEEFFLQSLPELKELSYQLGFHGDEWFNKFVHARELAGRPVIVYYDRQTSPDLN
ncbi:hypothetical protein BC827DRAFT_256218 [Russula dissimulans]|nr:hypothetical protein BC827DRAFT_256218 [Russula dissimulans]